MSSVSSTHDGSSPSRILVLAAFGAIYVIWGSTYLGTRYALDSIPPYFLVGSRSLIAGLVLYVLSVGRGATTPVWTHWRDSSITGFLMLVGGAGGVTWAVQFIPSGVAALMVALMPLWMVLFDWLRPRGVRPGRWVLIGLAFGFLGVGFLVKVPDSPNSESYAWGLWAVLISTLSWTLGSMYNRHSRKPDVPLQAVAMQMIAGGVFLCAIAWWRGEAADFAWREITALAAWSWLYLTLIGSMVGFTAYVWLLGVSTPARVSTYAFVNPLIAVALGCTIGREPFTWNLLVAVCFIVSGVTMIVAGDAIRQAWSRPVGGAQPEAGAAAGISGLPSNLK